MVNFYHDHDPAARGLDRWHFVYLHGAAERHNEEVALEEGWELAPSDLFLADAPCPAGPGAYHATLYGMPVVAVLAVRHGLPGGRVAVDDPNAPCWRHAMRPDEWR